MIEDRQYQIDDVNHAMNHGTERRPIHCAPTGSGKTVIQAKICKREMERGNATAILTPRNEIFTQTHALAGEICGTENITKLRAKREGESWNPIAPIHVCSWHTIVSRAKRSEFWFPKVKRVLVDEAHLSMAPKILEILEHYAPKAIVDGYTATPARMTGRGLGQYYSDIKHVTSVRQLIKEGYLAPVEYWGGATPDMKGIKVVRGDYENKKLSDACVVLVGDAVDNWLRLASERHSIVFAVDIAHAEMLAHRFKQCGVRAAALHTRLSDDERDEVNEQFKSQAIQVLVNVGIASYGYDAPSVNCIQICRPTKSIVLHLQMIGRGMRPGVNAEGERITNPLHHDFKTCIAKGQRVLTDQGLIPIEKVTLDMRVWDGLEFVYHMGIESRGKRQVIEYAGLTATPDHKVWTAEGVWRRLEVAKANGNQITVAEIKGNAIREDCGYVRSGNSKQKRPSRRCGSVPRLSEIITSVAIKCRAWNGWLSRVRSISRNADTEVALAAMFGGKISLHEPIQSSLPRLRWPRYRVPLQLSYCDGRVDTGSPRFAQRPNNRPDRQRWSLRSWQYSLGNTAAATTEPETTEVYDIVNAGPRRRFTVEGLIVSNCIVLDHAGNVPSLGMADDLFRWRLDEGKKACENWSKREESGESDDAKVHECQECHHLFSGSRVCPCCGWKVPFSKREVSTEDADLVLIGKSMTKKLPEDFSPSHEIFYAMLLHEQQACNYKPQWAAAQFKNKCDVWAPLYWNEFAPVPPSKRVKNWITSRRIAYAAVQRKLKAAGG